MAKKQKEETTNVNATANRDIVQRLNFLYQASIYLQSVATSTLLDSKGKGRQLKQNRDEDGIQSMDVDGALCPGATHNTEAGKSKKKLKRKVGTKRTTGDLARTYVQCMRIVGQKTTVKIDPCLKRSLCSGCSSTLVPGSSASIRVKKSLSQGQVIIYTCLHCRTTKRIPTPPNSIETDTQADPSTSQSSPHTTDTSISRGLPSTLNEPVIALGGRPKGIKSQRLLIPKSLPLFARPDAGHVIFRGNERLLLDEESGLGVFLS